MNIFIDEARGRALDRYLTRKFEKWMAKGVTFHSAVHACALARLYAIGYTKLVGEIRGVKNAIAWSYGDVAVLRGQGSEIISSNTKGSTQVEPKQEALLLPPWQNKGHFFP